MKTKIFSIIALTLILSCSGGGKTDNSLLLLLGGGAGSNNNVPQRTYQVNRYDTLNVVKNGAFFFENYAYADVNANNYNKATYDANNRIIQIDCYTYHNGSYIISKYYTFVYDINNNIIEEHCNWLDSLDDPNSMRFGWIAYFTYDANNAILTRTDYGYNTITKVWSNTDQGYVVYTNDADGKRLSIDSYNDLSMSQHTIHKDYTYDVSGKLIRIDSWDYAGVNINNKYFSLFEYTGDNVTKITSGQINPGTGLIMVDRYTYTYFIYNSSNDLIQKTKYNCDSEGDQLTDPVSDETFTYLKENGTTISSFLELISYESNVYSSFAL